MPTLQAPDHDKGDATVGAVMGIRWHGQDRKGQRLRRQDVG